MRGTLGDWSPQMVPQSAVTSAAAFLWIRRAVALLAAAAAVGLWLGLRADDARARDLAARREASEFSANLRRALDTKRRTLEQLAAGLDAGLPRDDREWASRALVVGPLGTAPWMELAVADGVGTVRFAWPDTSRTLRAGLRLPDRLRGEGGSADDPGNLAVLPGRDPLLLLSAAAGPAGSPRVVGVLSLPALFEGLARLQPYARLAVATPAVEFDTDPAGGPLSPTVPLPVGDETWQVRAANGGETAAASRVPPLVLVLGLLLAAGIAFGGSLPAPLALAPGEDAKPPQQPARPRPEAAPSWPPMRPEPVTPAAAGALTASDPAIITTDRLGLVRGLNGAATRWLGYQPQGTVNLRRIMDLVAPGVLERLAADQQIDARDAASVKPLVAAAMDGRPAVRVLPFRTRDGAVVSARVTVTALAGAAGDTTGYAVVAVPGDATSTPEPPPASTPAPAGPILELTRLVERLVGALDGRDGRFEALLKEHARTFQVLLRQVHESPAAVAGRAVVANAAPPPAPAPPAAAQKPPPPVHPAPVPPRDASAADLPVHGSLRVLVVEDNVVHQRVAVRKLKQLGHRADTAPNGSEALAMMMDAPYDFVLMDCEMPVMDGFEATRRIRLSETDGRHVLIVALTGHQSPEAHARAIAAGMDDLLEKPLRLSELEGLIARHRGVPSLAS